MTKKAYEDVKLKTFKAKVLQIIEDKDTTWVVTDSTIFYPLGGGQEPDRGTLGGSQVLFVKEEEGTIYHEVKDVTLKEGDEVEQVIDYNRRYDFMVQHTGEHILTGIITQDYGLNNVGFHIGEKSMRIDYDGMLTEDELKAAVYKANEAVRQGLQVKAYYPNDEEIKETPYRFKKEILEDIRLVDIPGVDMCACCGTHVENTREVGVILVASKENYKGGLRLNVLCGDRALDFFYSLYEDSEKVSQLMSAPMLGTAPAVARLQEDLKVTRKTLGHQEAELVELKAESLEEADVIIIETQFSKRGLEDFLKRGMGKVKDTLVLLTPEEEGLSFLMMSHERDLREITKDLNETFQGRGGGKPQRTQGKLQGKLDEVKTFIEGRLTNG